jgi:hypothetical protein
VAATIFILWSLPVALNTIPCPSCGAGVHSAAGFTAGQAVSCPKCETEFTVDAATLRSAAGETADEFIPGKSAAAANEPEWSYRNSTLRYVVLGVLLVILVGLAYMLYDKRMRERDAAATGTSEDRDGERAGLPNKMLPLPGNPIAAGGPIGGRPKGGPKANDTPAPKAKSKSMTVDEAKTRIAGRWENDDKDQVLVIEYKPDGSFSYGEAKDGKIDKPINGKWTMTKVETANTGPLGMVNILNMEWTIDGRPPVKEVILLRNDGTTTHLLMDPESLPDKARATFRKKK